MKQPLDEERAWEMGKNLDPESLEGLIWYYHNHREWLGTQASTAITEVLALREKIAELERAVRIHRKWAQRNSRVLKRLWRELNRERERIAELEKALRFLGDFCGDYCANWDDNNVVLHRCSPTCSNCIERSNWKLDENKLKQALKEGLGR